MAKGFANVEAVDAAGQRVQSDDDVHVVLCNGVVCDCAEVGLLVAVVELGAGEVYPCSVGGGDAKGVDADGGEFVDATGVKVRSIASFEDRSAVGAKVLAKRPFIGRCASGVD